MKFKDIPSYAIRPFVKSRVDKPLEFGVATQLDRRNTDGQVTATWTVIAYGNLVSTVRNTVGSTESAPSNRAWTTTRYADAAAAFEFLRAEIGKMFDRSYESVTDGLMVIPFNETDVRYAMKSKEMPVWAFGLVYHNYMTTRSHTEEVASASAAKATTPVASAPATFTPVTAAGASITSASAATAAMTDHTATIKSL